MPNKKQQKIERLQEAREEVAAYFEELAAKDKPTLSMEELIQEESLVCLAQDKLEHVRNEDGTIRYLGLTGARLSVFLRELSETGSLASAARKATPWEISKGSSLQTFLDYAEQNHEFKEAIESAKDFALGRVEHELVRRAMTPTLRPIFSNGLLMGYEEKWDNRLLLRVAEAMDPSRWSQKHELKHTGEITHGVMVVPSQTQTPEEWEAQYEDAEHPQLDVVEAELLEEGKVP